MISSPLRRIVLSVLFAVPVSVASAAIKLPAMFADHMVLQRGMEVPVWGSGAEPNARVEVEYARGQRSHR